MSTKMTGGKIIVEMLLHEGVDTLFGYPGGVVLGIFDELFDAPIRVVLTRHEQGAAHAADGYARVTGKVGVCMATSGPGATNLVTGIANAYMDSVPMVAITGQVATPLIGGDAFQEADITGITRPITKHNYLVKDVKDLAQTLHDAFHIAATGRPGPVLVDIPKDVTTEATSFNPPTDISMRGYKPTYEGHIMQIRRAAAAIKKANELAYKIQSPVTLTLMGLGVMPTSDPLFMGMPGMHGTFCANHAITESDVLIAIGVRFSDRVTGKIEQFAPHARVIHIDIDPAAISKNVRVDVPIVGDVGQVLDKLVPELDECDSGPWLEQVAKWKEQHPLTYDRDSDGIKPQYVVEQICEATNGEAVITTEVGQNQMWAAHYYSFTRPRQFLSSGGLGTMGYGFPAAIGAQLGSPDSVVFDIAGDGSIQMNIQELATSVRMNLPVNIAILNNQFLGMVRQWQQLFFARRYSSTCLVDNPDFVKIAEAYGAEGIRIERKKDVRPAIERAIASPKTVVMDFAVEREENVWPMVPAGAAIDDMMMEEP